MAEDNKKIIVEDSEELKQALEKKDQENPDHNEVPFFSVDIRQFCGLSRNIFFDVFIRMGEEKFTRVFSKETGVDYSRLAQYIQKGITDLYIRNEDGDAFQKFLTYSPMKILENTAATKEEVSAALLDMTDQNVSQLCMSLSIDDAVIEKTRAIVKKYVDFMKNEPSILTALIRGMRQKEGMFAHAVSVSVISMLLCEKSANTSNKSLEICGLAGILHDIGKTQIKDQQDMKQHPKIGCQMLEKCDGISHEVRLAILQHHEEPAGTGYPNGIGGPKIIFPAKVIAIADAFVNLITDQPFRKGFPADQAIQNLMLERGRFDRALLTSAQALFGKNNTTKKAA